MSTAQNQTSLCANGCGFYGNPATDNMCSKCFAAKKKASEAANNITANTAPVKQQFCKNGCSFFGNPAYEGYCSKCWREIEVTKKVETAPLSSSPALSSTPKPTTDVKPLEITPQAAPSATTSSSSSSATDSASATSTEAPPASSQTEVAPAEPSSERAVQKNTSKCWKCSKKVGLTGIECRCGYVFCGTHRYADQHECDFDYKADERRKLAKANPLVQADKLSKL